MFLQQVHYWIGLSGKTYDGYEWIYNSYTQWHEQMPFWSVETIKRTVTSLEKRGLLISANYNKTAIDRTKWYRVNYEKLAELEEGLTRPSGQNDPTIRSERPDEEVKMTRAIPETTTETTTETFVENDKPVENAPSKKEKSITFPAQDYHDVIDYVAKLQRLDKFANYPMQAKNVKNLFIAGLTVTEIKAVADIMWSETYWRDKGLDFVKIYAKIDEYRLKLKKKTQVYADPDDLPPDQWDQIPERYPGEFFVLEQLRERGYIWDTVKGKYVRNTTD